MIDTQKNLPVRGGFQWIGYLILAGLLLFLFSLITPAISSCRERARRIQCLNCLRQIGLGVKAYAADHQNLFPEGGAGTVSVHFRLLSNYVGNAGQIFKCPTDHDKTLTNRVDSIEDWNISYCYVRGLNDSAPIDTPVAFDRGLAGTAADGYPLASFANQRWSGPHTRHSEDYNRWLWFFPVGFFENVAPEGGNILFAGAHVTFNSSFPRGVNWNTNVVEVP